MINKSMQRIIRRGSCCQVVVINIVSSLGPEVFVLRVSPLDVSFWQLREFTSMFFQSNDLFPRLYLEWPKDNCILSKFVVQS